jgi:phosphohistidine swiveling domain-containing protein
MKNIEQLIVELLGKIIESKAGDSKVRLSRADSLVNAKTGRKTWIRARKSKKHDRRVRRVFGEEGEAVAFAVESVLSASAFIKVLKEKGHININGIIVWPTDFFSAVKLMKNIFEKQQVISFLIHAYQSALVTSEYTAHDIATLVHSLPKPDRARLEEELKGLVITAVERQVMRNELPRFVNEVLPELEFLPDYEKEIVDTLNINKKVSEETIIATRDEVLNHLRSLQKAHLHFAIPVLRNIITCIRINPPQRVGPPSHEEVTFYRVVKESLKEAICGIEGSHKLYPLIRQILRDTFYLSSSKIERIDRLCRIAEQEVNVSTHKGQDLLSPGDLRKILENNHQRRPSGPGGTFDPNVTQALKELLSITEELSTKDKGFALDADESAFDGRLRKRVRQANTKFRRGEELEALLDLTALRKQLSQKIDSKIRQADSMNHSDVRRYGPHIEKAGIASQDAIKCTEMDIVLERMINDYCADVFQPVFDNLREAPVAEIPTQFSRTLAAVYIIAENAVLSGFGDRNLAFFAQHVLVMSLKGAYGSCDCARAYGFIHQIRLLIGEIIHDLEQEYKWRVEAVAAKKLKKSVKDSPESLAFVQDLLRTTAIRQFGERFIVRVEGFFKNLAGESEFFEGLNIDPILQKDVASIANLPQPTKAAIAVPLKECKGFGKQTIGTKAHGLATIIDLGFPVPDGFVVVADIKKTFLPDQLRDTIRRQLRALEKRTDKKIGNSENPLILSLRSSFPVSMPGAFPTVTNAGMNERVMRALEKRYNRKFALECYIRFMRSYYDMMADTLYPIDYVVIPQNATIEELKHLLAYYEELAFEGHVRIPDDPWKQIEDIVDKIMYHSMKSNVQISCALHGIPSDWFLSVIIQDMVFGNLDNSYTAVVHTRATRDGSRNLEAEVLFGRQGEDLVSRKRTLEAQRTLPEKDEAFLKEVRRALEREFGPTEIELTNQQGQTSFLQARSARLNPEATKRALWDMVKEGILTNDQARKYLNEKALGLPTVDSGEKPLCRGTGVSGGAITGGVALSIEKALEYTEKGRNAILVLEYTPGREMQDRYSREIGVLTAHGGTAQHYAAWCRSLGRPYVTMVDDMEIDVKRGLVRLGRQIFRDGDELTIDGTMGNIYEGPRKFVFPDAASYTEQEVALSHKKRRRPNDDDQIDPMIGISL